MYKLDIVQFFLIQVLLSRFRPKRILKLEVRTPLLKPPFSPSFETIAMADEDPPSELSVTLQKPKLDEILNVSKATTESDVLGGLDSSCNCSNETKPAAESTAQTSDGSGEKSLELAEELLEKGSKAIKDNDFVEAVDCFSRALEIRLGFGYFSLSLQFLLDYELNSGTKMKVELLLPLES